MTGFGINVLDFGAKGDGIADDTAAIQAAINFAAERGGGRILFPYTKGGYRVASPAVEEYEGKPLRAQLMIPPGSANIMLEGEMPCRMLNSYQVRPPESVAQNFEPTRFVEFTGHELGENNTRIFSDWDAPRVAVLDREHRFQGADETGKNVSDSVCGRSSERIAGARL